MSAVTSISRQHAEIRHEGRGHVLRDLGSRNGVFVNGKRAPEVILAPDQVLRLGEWIGIVVELPEEHVEASPVFETFGQGLAGGPALRPVIAQARAAAAQPLPTVLFGESGTEKEALAQAMHGWSGRQGPFVVANCETLAPAQAVAELVGFRKGAFPGADHDHDGLLRAAHGGTLLLNDIAALPEPAQPLLLRALQQQEVLPLGEPSPSKVDVRVIATTELPLSRAVARRQLRADLRARLDGRTIQLPSLRERRQDIAFLFWDLLRGFTGGYPPAADSRLIERLCLHEWPYNARELELLARRMWLQHGREDVLRCVYLPKAILRDLSAGVGPGVEPPKWHRMRKTASSVQRAHPAAANPARADATVGSPRPQVHCQTETAGPFVVDPTSDGATFASRFGRE
jgi:DNA-binding NtrC family response regulator